MKRNTQKGFTIIELVVVILLLGILTATALPRFMDVTDEAHDAVVDGVVAGLATSSGLFRAQWYATGQPTTVADYAGLRANASGYAIGLTGATLDTNQDCVDIFNTFLQAPGRPSVALAAATGAIATSDVSAVASPNTFVAKVSGGVCSFGYVGQFNDGAASATTVPVITYTASTGNVALGSEI